MANNYTQTAFEIPCTAEQAAVLLDAVEAYYELSDDGEPRDNTLAKTLIEEHKDTSGFGTEVSYEGGSLYFVMEEGGDLELLARLIQLWLQATEQTIAVGFTWANTCSKMRIGEFDGGGVTISRDDMQWFSVWQMVEKAKKEMEAGLTKGLAPLST